MKPRADGTIPRSVSHAKALRREKEGKRISAARSPPQSHTITIPNAREEDNLAIYLSSVFPFFPLRHCAFA